MQPVSAVTPSGKVSSTIYVNIPVNISADADAYSSKFNY